MASLARRLKQLFQPQPRIAGLTREPGSTALLPVVEARYRAQARSEGKSVSRVKAEALCRAKGYDAATGAKLGPRLVSKATRKQ
jgi:hypothetical protein